MSDNARGYARTCGLIYVLIFVAGLFGEIFVRGRVVAGNDVATAANIVRFEQLWRTGFAAEVVTLLCDITVAWLLYVLLAPVDRNLAILAAIFRLTYVAVYSVATLADYFAIPLASGHLTQATALSLRVHNEAFALSLIFFGANLALAGYLIGRMPIGVSWLAVALEVAGGAYILNSFTLFVAPAIQSAMYPWILILPFIGELSLCFWLLFTRRFDAVMAAA